MVVKFDSIIQKRKLRPGQIHLLLPNNLSKHVCSGVSPWRERERGVGGKRVGKPQGASPELHSLRPGGGKSAVWARPLASSLGGCRPQPLAGHCSPRRPHQEAAGGQRGKPSFGAPLKHRTRALCPG